MCCEVFWRNDTLYNAEVNCYSSSLTPHDAQCTNWECKWGRSGRGWRECPEVRQQLGVDGAPRQRSSPSMIHEGMSKKTLNSKWSKVFFFLSPMTEETKVLLNWPCWSPCSTMNESLWMNCHCMTTGTKRVEKFNCYFAVCFVFFFLTLQLLTTIKLCFKKNQKKKRASSSKMTDSLVLQNGLHASNFSILLEVDHQFKNR